MIETLIRLDGRGLIARSNGKGPRRVGTERIGPALRRRYGSFRDLLAGCWKASREYSWEGKADKPGQFWIKVLSIPVSELRLVGRGRGLFSSWSAGPDEAVSPEHPRVNIEQ
jgi:hypothetical protein